MVTYDLREGVHAPPPPHELILDNVVAEDALQVLVGDLALSLAHLPTPHVVGHARRRGRRCWLVGRGRGDDQSRGGPPRGVEVGGGGGGEGAEEGGGRGRGGVGVVAGGHVEDESF